MLVQTTSGPGIQGQGWGWGWIGDGVQGLNGLGFSERITTLTLLLCLVFGHGQKAHCEEWWRDKQ